LSLWTLDTNFVTNFEERNVAGDIALLVRLETIRTHVAEGEIKATLIRRSK
jgi:hypothetical protein